MGESTDCGVAIRRLPVGEAPCWLSCRGLASKCGADTPLPEGVLGSVLPAADWDIAEEGEV